MQWLISYSSAGSDLIYHLNLEHNEYQDVKLLLWEKNSLSLLIMKYVKAIYNMKHGNKNLYQADVWCRKDSEVFQQI